MADNKLTKKQQLESIQAEVTRPMPTMKEVYSNLLQRMQGAPSLPPPPSKNEKQRMEEEYNRQKFTVPDVRESQADYKRAMDKLDELDKRRIIEQFRQKQQEKPVIPQMSEEQLRELQSEFEAPEQAKQNALKKLLNK